MLFLNLVFLGSNPSTATNCGTWSKLLKLFWVLQFPHLENDNNSTSLVELL